MTTTFDFEDGNGPVPAHRHRNPDGNKGGGGRLGVALSGAAIGVVVI